MIIARPMGGMGNQMYCYALGKALSLKKNTPLRIDKSWVDEVGAEKGLDLFSLANFKLECAEWRYPRSGLRGLLSRRKADRIFAWLSQMLPRRWKSILVERQCRYDEWIREIKSRTIYIRAGTWQSYKYFRDCEDEIRRDFEFKEEVYEANRGLADRILADKQSVSVHMRRGDYVANSEYAYTQGICTRQYYDNALEYFRHRLPSPTFYFFSDDIGFVKSEFGSRDGYVFVDRRESRGNEVGFRDDGHHDMYLMSLCRNNIIANSTFSWWAAFLNKSKEKMVVAPDRWYNGVADDSFILRPDWIRISGKDS